MHRARCSIVSENREQAVIDRHGELIQRVGEYYSDRLRAHGPTHRGVDWNSTESQNLRFEQILKIVDTKSFSINDVGCGYGALAGYLLTTGAQFKYHGTDCAGAMIEEAKRLFGLAENCVFDAERSSISPADYTVASGIFNVRLEFDDEQWLEYVCDTIAYLAENSIRGFAFNMLTRYSDADRMRPDLYYADPHFFFDHCRERYSRHLALLHDYPLYEFTLLVRL
jgi:SAM-dependent methyltransferase